MAKTGAVIILSATARRGVVFIRKAEEPLKFTRKTDYALRIMQLLARREATGPVSMKSMSEGTNMTLKFLQSVSRNLSRAGLIHAKSGPRGGLVLSRLPGEISVLEIIEAAEGKINLMDCIDHPTVCTESSGCSIMSVLSTAQNALVETLRSTTLKLMVDARQNPFNKVPRGNYQNPVHHCPAVKVPM